MHFRLLSDSLLLRKVHGLSNTSQGESQCYYSGAYLTLCFGRLWWAMMVCEGWMRVVYTSLCLVTGYDVCRDTYASVYMMCSLFCQAVTNDNGVCACADTLMNSHSQEQQLLSVWTSLVSTQALLFRGWWIKPSQREGGTGSVRTLLASLSSGRWWEWLADPLLTLVRRRNPSSWLKCHLTADNWLITVCHVTSFSLKEVKNRLTFKWKQTHKYDMKYNIDFNKRR